MLALHKLTSEYLEGEDRFRLTGEDQSGKALCLWLTQRLALRLVSHVVEVIASNSIEALQNPCHDDDTNAFLQGAAQEEAKKDLTPQEAVVSTSTSSNMLVAEVDISRPSEGLIHFVFKDGINEEVALGFEPQQLRQWLIIMYAQWLKAEWPLTIWPEWISGQSADLEAAATTRDPSNPVH